MAVTRADKEQELQDLATLVVSPQRSGCAIEALAVQMP